jgi:SAM-dependent methyltransferase
MVRFAFSGQGQQVVPRSWREPGLDGGVQSGYSMSRFQITLMRPPGFQHTEAFREVAESLQFGLRSIGHSAQIQENVFDARATNILLGAHLLSPQQVRLVPPGSVLYNLEQLGGPILSPQFYEVAFRNQVWDYSLQNIGKWEALKCDHRPVHVPLGYVPEMSRIKAAQVQDIDVLFYGSLNERRTRIVNALKDAGATVHVSFGVYGRDRDELIARAKIVLNVHFYDAKIFEIVRVSYLLANSKAVVTEFCADTELEEGLDNAVLGFPYNSLVNGCLALLEDAEQRRKLEMRGLKWFSQRKESEILSKALHSQALQTQAPKTILAPEVNLPTKLNLGSGKDWREDYFNVDCDPYWEPDAVLDFNNPLPIGKRLETQRFGSMVLENDSFDELLANDSLEHIPNLMTAMNSCLNLLKVGGLFRISVPYDLSWGAWQDPTHVRAFNERSWLYYTDWFWYMGWTKARFDLAQFDLSLSPVGEQLRKQQVKGEDLVRHPRAVDRMSVVLCKRLLTQAETEQVAVYLKRPNRKAAAAGSPAGASPE